MANVTPHIVVRDAGRAAEWYRDALGAELGGRIETPDGRFMQIELVFGDSTVMIADEFPEFGDVSPATLRGTSCTLTIAVEDADAAWRRAIAAGAMELRPLEDAFWGERYGQILDPSRHRWGIAQKVEDVPPEEVQRRAIAFYAESSNG
jgi:PhnB protein